MCLYQGNPKKQLSDLCSREKKKGSEMNFAKSCIFLGADV